MKVLFDNQIDELLALGGTFDITGTGSVTNKQFWGFNASDGAVLNILKGIPLKTAITNLASITAAEVDLTGMILTNGGDPLFGGLIYRVDGYIITNVKLTSGSLHLYKTNNQITS
jgi:hypothetical protein